MWHVSHGEKNYGPFAEDKILALIKAGKLPPSVYVWKDGMADWVMLRDSPLMQPAPPAAVPVMAEVVTPVAAANPFDFAKPVVRNQPAAAAINVSVAPQPTPQQLANPYFSDFQGNPAQATASPAVNRDFRPLPLQGRQLFVIIALAITGVLTLLCAWLTFEQTSLIKRMMSGAYGTNIHRALADAKASDDQFLIVFLTFLGALLVLTIAFAMWFYRAHLNAQGMTPAKLTDTSGWAVGYFFIPVMNLFKPFVGMRDVWRGTMSAPGSYAAPPATLVGMWWATWLAMNLLNRVFVFSFERPQASVDYKLALLNISMIGNIFMLAPLVLTFLLVTKITQQQARKAQQLTQGVTLGVQQTKPAAQAYLGEIKI